MSCYVVGAKIFAAAFPPPGEEKTFQHLSLRLKEIEITMKMKIGVRNEGTEAGNKNLSVAALSMRGVTASPVVTSASWSLSLRIDIIPFLEV